MLTKLIFLLLTLQIKTKETNFSCQKLIPEEKIFFNFWDPDLSIKKDKFEIEDKNKKIPGMIHTQICSDIKIPEECNVEGNARFIFVPDNLSENNCIVFKPSNLWDVNYKKKTKDDQYFLFKQLKEIEQKISVKKTLVEDDSGFTVEYRFICSENDLPTYIFKNTNKIFKIDIYSKKSCANKIPFFSLFFENLFFSGAFLLIIGLISSFSGIIVYKF